VQVGRGEVNELIQDTREDKARSFQMLSSFSYHLTRKKTFESTAQINISSQSVVKRKRKLHVKREMGGHQISKISVNSHVALAVITVTIFVHFTTHCV